MKAIGDCAALEALYGVASAGSLYKVAQEITPLYRHWIEAARFVVLSTVGPEGTDASPRGDAGPVARIYDVRTLLIPDWKGNNRLDSLRNIVRDGRVSLMFMVPGSQNVVRVNGRGIVTAEKDILDSFAREGKTPATVIAVTIEEIYFQCAKAIMRSRLWSSGDESGGLPSAGAFLREAQEGFDAETYDAGYQARAQEQLW